MTIHEQFYSDFPLQGPKIPSKDDMILTVFQELVKRYIDATAPYWKDMLELYFSTILVLNNRFRSPKESFVRLLNWFIIGALQKRKKSPAIPSCDVVLCYSTPKSIWQFPMQTLAERLASRGYRVALINSRMMEIVEYDQNSKEVLHREIEGFIDYRDRSSNRLKSVLNLIRSFSHTAALFPILKKDKELRRELFRNPFSIWVEFFTSLQFFDFSEKFIRQIKPRLIVSNHIILPFISELLTTPASQSAHRVWLCNENPAFIHIPAGVCDEIWFWNQVHMDSHRLLVKPDADIHMEISGHAETDMAVTLDARQLPVSDEETKLKDITGGRRVLLYLSTYYPPTTGIDMNSNAVSYELADWLEYVSTKHPDWCFIYKDRPVRFGEYAPGFDRLKKLPNWLFPQTEINFLNFLKWDNLEIVAADSSLGLITAAGMTKLPLWLSAPSQEEHFLPNVEQIALRVFSADAFDGIFSNIDEISPAYKRWLEEKRDEIFPYRGGVLDRMEEFCIRRLSA